MENVMEYAPLGRTGLRVSRIGYGAAGLGNMYTHVEQADANRSIAMAMEEYGINYFDVAPSYGPEGLAEERLGIGLEGRRHRVVLSTKCGRYDHGTVEHTVFEVNFDPARMRLELERSLRRLRTDYVDIFQLHDITNSENLDYLIAETLPELERLRQEGKLRFIGITSADLQALRYVAERAPGVDSILTFGKYNLMNTTLEGALDDLRDRGVGVVNSSITFMGFITKSEAGVHNYGNPRGLERMRAKLDEANAICDRRGVDLGAFAVQFGLCCDHCADSTLISMARPARLRQNMELFRHRREYDRALAEELHTLLKDANAFRREDFESRFHQTGGIQK